jgi:hypothetical protein
MPRLHITSSHLEGLDEEEIEQSELIAFPHKQSHRPHSIHTETYEQRLSERRKVHHRTKLSVSGKDLKES